MLESTAMDDPNEFRKLLQEIIKKDPEPTLSPENLTFEVEVMKVSELVGDWVLWLN